MTGQEIIAEFAESIDREGLDVDVGLDVFDRVVLSDPAGRWRVAIRPGAPPLDVDREGTPPIEDEAFQRAVWSIVERLTGAPDQGSA